MKAWKEALVKAFVKECDNARAVKFHEVALENGHDHVLAEDMWDIVTRLKKMGSNGELPQGYVLATDGPVGQRNSMFQALMLVEEASGMLA